VTLKSGRKPCFIVSAADFYGPQGCKVVGKKLGVKQGKFLIFQVIHKECQRDF